MGTACWGWKIYEVGELSMMIVSLRSRPICERSCDVCQYLADTKQGRASYLYVIALVVVATFAEESVVDNAMDIKLVEKRVPILKRLAYLLCPENAEHTFETDAVNTTTSYSSPTLFMNWSTPGRLMTYTLWYWPSISTGMVKSAWCSI